MSSSRINAVSHGFGVRLYDIQIVADGAKAYLLLSEFGSVAPESIPSIFGGNFAKAGFRCGLVKYILFLINPLVCEISFLVIVPCGIFESRIV